VRTYKAGDGWDAKTPPKGLKLIHKPAFIVIMKNPEAESDDNNDTVYMTDKFILQSLTENRTERVQILETFGTSAISFFNSKTKIYQIAGTFIEARGGKTANSYNWKSVFEDLYENHLRGSMLMKEKNIAILNVLDNLIYFYPINLVVGTVANAPHTAAFNMNIIVTRHVLTAGDMSENYTTKFLDINKLLGLYESRVQLKIKESNFDTVVSKDSTNKEINTSFTEYMAQKAEYDSLTESATVLIAECSRGETNNTILAQRASQAIEKAKQAKDSEESRLKKLYDL
jgi:hypothetical protein